ncbi:MAG TPA: tetratricopeptide repeat protein [Gammaproteobacteria bacterium]|nr:tetratricopeptide repeat protein [Gammaproteobacteria bacterium]
MLLSYLPNLYAHPFFQRADLESNTTSIFASAAEMCAAQKGEHMKKVVGSLLVTLVLGYTIQLIAAAKPSSLAQTLEVVKTVDKDLLSKSELSSENLLKILSAEMALNREEPEVALKNYIAVAKETQDPAIAQRATQIALSIASLEDALLPAEIWAKNDPKNLEAQITVAAIFIRIAKPQKSVPYLKKLMEIDPIDSDRHFVMLYKQLTSSADQQNVLKALELVSKDAPKSNLAHVALADIAIYDNRLQDALRLAQDALKIQHKDPKATILYAQALLQNSELDKANAFLEKQLKAIPDSLPLMQYYTQFLIEQKALDKAQIQMNLLTENKALSTRQLLHLSQVSMQVGWYDQAEKLLHKVRDDKEHVHTANYFLARIYEERNNIPEAVTWYEKVQEGPFHVISYIRASVLLADSKHYEKALGLLNYVEPQNYADVKRIALAKVDIFSRSKENQKALDLLNALLQQEPEDLDYLYSRALIYEKLSQIKNTEADFKKILEIDPNHVDALNALGFILADHTERFSEAKEYIEKALKLAPDNPSVLDSLGWVHYKMGNTKLAIETLRKALSLFPDPEIAAHLGEVLWSSNQQAEATKVWNEALEASPNDQRVIKTMERLVGETHKSN